MSDYQKAYDALPNEIRAKGNVGEITEMMRAKLNVYPGCPLVQEVRKFVTRTLLISGKIGQFIPPRNPKTSN